MGNEQAITLDTEAAVLCALALGLARYGPAEASPDWFIPFAWLCTRAEDFLALVSVRPASPGLDVNSLKIETPGAFLAGLRAGRSGVLQRHPTRPLPAVPSGLSPPDTLTEWNGPLRSLEIVERTIAGKHTTVACGLLFNGEGGKQLLVGCEQAVPSLVLSDDSQEVGAYLKDCSIVSLRDYFARRCA